MDRSDLIDRLVRRLDSADMPIICAYLFGSHARGAARPDSDVDVAVLFETQAPRGLVGPLSTLRGELERSVEREVDLIDLRFAPVDLAHRVLRDGLLLVDRNPVERIRFEERTRNLYFDLLPYLLEYRRGAAA